MTGYISRNKPSQFTGADEKEGAKDNPLVSIITPVLNGMKYLEICIQNVLNQSYPYIEHIFVDGGSTDGTLEILAGYQARYPERIRFISGRDKGVGDAVNKGYRISKGGIIGWIDSDDIYEPDAVQTVVEFFRRNPDAYFVYGGCDRIDDKGKVIDSFVIKDFDLREWINYWHYIVLDAAFYKREVIERVGYLNALGNDLDFYLRVHKKFKLHRIEKKLASWRQHMDSVTYGEGKKERAIVRKRVRQDFFLTIRYGGSIFSKRNQRYRPFPLSLLPSVVKGLRLILGPTYPSVRRVIGRCPLFR